jgi:hypothetical protein
MSSARDLAADYSPPRVDLALKAEPVSRKGNAQDQG